MAFASALTDSRQRESGAGSPGNGCVQVAAWEHIPWLVAAFSTRHPGVSQVYGTAEQNLGWTREDDPLHVAENRRGFLQEVAGDRTYSLLTVKQIHGSLVHDFSSAPAKGTAGETDVPQGAAPFARDAARTSPVPPKHCEGDGLISAQPGQLLGILTADCVPVLVADTRTRVVAAFHAGWRGTLARIVENGVRILRERHGTQPEDLVAAIGPAIRPCCFEVGAEIRTAFTQTFPYADTLFTSPHAGANPTLDLQAANRQQLLDAGLRADAIQTLAECTSCCKTAAGQRKYFSYRAESGVTGRMLSVIGTKANL